MEERYYTRLAAATVRGNILRCGREDILSGRLIEEPIESLREEEFGEIISLAAELDVKLYHFKKSERILPRISVVIGFLKGICFESILDVGSGRGAFLFPLLEGFPYAQVSSLDILEKRYLFLSDISRGGITRLSVSNRDICDMPYAEKSFDVVTMLEVLEHIPDTEAAVFSAVKMAREYVIVTVPSKEDDNPEHIHLLTQEKLTDVFMRAGAKKLSFDAVSGHLIMIAKV